MLLKTKTPARVLATRGLRWFITQVILYVRGYSLSRTKAKNLGMERRVGGGKSKRAGFRPKAAGTGIQIHYSHCS